MLSEIADGLEHTLPLVRLMLFVAAIYVVGGHYLDPPKPRRLLPSLDIRGEEE